MIGYESFSSLEMDAQSAGFAVATYVRDRISKSVSKRPDIQGENAIQSTFKGGRGSPLHDWYPYLEGYSPAFVQSIIRQYAPNAQTILDPFCGSGTTALVSSSMARTGYFAEVNPMCRYVIETKAKALTLSEAVRDGVVAALDQAASRLATAVRKCPQSKELKARFIGSLGVRPIFDPKTLENVLRLRTYLDIADNENPDISPFLTMAVLRSLVPCSLMVRRGDLRFRTEKELAGFHPDIIEEVRSSIYLISSDLRDLVETPNGVKFVCNNARDVGNYFSSELDAVITSPPYLNGTNYFRNTKIELCFMGFFRNKSDLRSFRDQAITAGINDVTSSKTRGGVGRELPSLLTKTLTDLSKSAYDIRIPAMVQSYFQEMDKVSEGLGRILRPGGIAAIDLGDSCYGGVHVPTDIILANMMEDHGFTAGDRIILRERQSRDGGRLSQTLQIFERKGSTKKRKSPSKRQDAAWDRFKTDLPHQKGEMAKRNWGHPWHSLCSYQGKLKPSIASTLVAALMPSDRAGRLLDPFSGVGTVPFEARLAGHEAFGFDISPAAVVISKAKLGQPDPSAVEDVMLRLTEWVSAAKNRRIAKGSLDAIRFNGPLEDYFNPKTLGEIVAARSFFRAHPPRTSAEALVMACLLHVLHGNRPYALSRRSHPITPFAPTGPAEYRSLVEKVRGKLQRSMNDLPNIQGCREGRVFSQDITERWPDEVCDLDAIITSPPFFDSTRFHTANWMRLWFAGWEAPDFISKPKGFVDERQKQSFDLYDAVFKQAADRLKSGGVMALHLGKSKKCDMAAALTGIGERYLELADSFSESVEHCESHGLKDKGTVTHHQYLLFRRR